MERVEVSGELRYCQQWDRRPWLAVSVRMSVSVEVNAYGIAVQKQQIVHTVRRQRCSSFSSRRPAVLKFSENRSLAALEAT